MAGVKSHMNYMIIIVLIIIVDAVGGYLIGRKLLIPYAYEKGERAAESAGTADAEIIKEGTGEPGLRKDLEAINLNPANSSGEVFSCQLTLEALEQSVINELTNRDPQIKDIILNYLSAKSIPEINDVSRREEYRKDIIDKINSVLTSGRITNLYITQWILQ